VVVSDILAEDSYSLDVTILADPIYWYEDLTVNLDGEAAGGDGPYTFYWDFWDGETAFWEDLDHLYDDEGVFSISLLVTDKNWATWTATVTVVVLEADSCLDDSDGDSIFDCDDTCPLISWPSSNSWCPILETSCDVNCSCPLWFSCSDGNTLTCWTGICEPEFTPNPSCLFVPGEGSIYGSALCTTCPCNTYVDFMADIRKCDLIFPAITSPDGREIYSRWNTWQIQ